MPHNQTNQKKKQQKQQKQHGKAIYAIVYNLHVCRYELMFKCSANAYAFGGVSQHKTAQCVTRSEQQLQQQQYQPQIAVAIAAGGCLSTDAKFVSRPNGMAKMLFTLQSTTTIKTTNIKLYAQMEEGLKEKNIHTHTQQKANCRI